jgi:8-oxo-dGTP pyrophosphatase MutT (NUDIX family)
MITSNAYLRLRASANWSGAGVLFYALDTKRFLFQQRSITSDDPLTYACFGGTTEDLETPNETARREVKEETGFNSKMHLIALPSYTKRPNFTFYNFLGIIESEFIAKTDYETKQYVWVKFNDWPEPLHEGMNWLLTNYSKQIKDIVNERH